MILGSGLDILEAGKPPRAMFLNYPLGFEAGRPFDEENQREVVRAAVAGFDSMKSPGIETLDFTWDAGWERIASKSGADTDQRSSRDTTPRYQTDLDRELAEGA